MDKERLYDSVKGAAILGALNFCGLLLYTLTVSPWLTSSWDKDVRVGLVLLAVWGFLMLTANVYTGLSIVEDRQ